MNMQTAPLPHLSTCGTDLIGGGKPSGSTGKPGMAAGASAGGLWVVVFLLKRQDVSVQLAAVCRRPRHALRAGRAGRWLEPLLPAQ